MTLKLLRLMWFSFTCLAFLITTSSRAEEGDEAKYLRLVRELSVLGSPWVSDLDFSRSGKWIATSGDKIRVFESRSGDIERETKLPPHKRATQTRIGELRVDTPTTTQFIRFSPVDDTRFAVACRDGVVRVFDVREEHARVTINAHPEGTLRGLCYSPDGQLLATKMVAFKKGKTAEGQFKVWDVNTGKQLFGKALDFVDVGAIAFSRDSQYFAVALQDARNLPKSKVEVYGRSEWKLKDSILFSPGFATSMAYSPDGKRLVIAGGECENRTENGCMPIGKFWFVECGSGKKPKMFRPDPRHGYFRSVSFSPSGKSFVIGTSQQGFEAGNKLLRKPTMLYTQGLLQCRDAFTGELKWASKGGVGAAYGAKCSPDGILAAHCKDGHIYLCDAETGTQVHDINLAPDAKELRRRRRAKDVIMAELRKFRIK